MYKTPTFAEPQQYNRPFSWGHVSAFINQYGNWHVATPQRMKKVEKWGHVSAFINQYGNWHVATSQ
jgi:hypothetical protein